MANKPLFNRSDFNYNVPYNRQPLAGKESNVPQAFSRRIQTDPTFAEAGTQADFSSGRVIDSSARSVGTNVTMQNLMEDDFAPRGEVSVEPHDPEGRPPGTRVAAAAAAGASGGGAAAASGTSGAAAKGVQGFTKSGGATLLGKLGHSTVSYLNNMRDLNNNSGIQNFYFGHVNGDQGYYHGMHGHATMRAMSMTRAAERMKLNTEFGASIGGPLGGLIAYGVTGLLKDKYMKDELAKNDYKTHYGTSGDRIDPRTAPSSTYRGDDAKNVAGGASRTADSAAQPDRPLDRPEDIFEPTNPHAPEIFEQPENREVKPTPDLPSSKSPEPNAKFYSQYTMPDEPPSYKSNLGVSPRASTGWSTVGSTVSDLSWDSASVNSGRSSPFVDSPIHSPIFSNRASTSNEPQPGPSGVKYGGGGFTGSITGRDPYSYAWGADPASFSDSSSPDQQAKPADLPI
nr:MAG: hypothetical protein [Owegonang virus 1]